jgi:hypothetical protein
VWSSKLNKPKTYCPNPVSGADFGPPLVKGEAVMVGRAWGIAQELSLNLQDCEAQMRKLGPPLIAPHSSECSGIPKPECVPGMLNEEHLLSRILFYSPQVDTHFSVGVK